MTNFADSSERHKRMIPCYLRPRLAWLYHSFSSSLLSLLRTFIFQVNQFWIELGYFITLSSLGFLALKASKPRTARSFKPKYIDLFFTSVSASTVSSMSTVEMEVFSNTQLVFLTVLMFVGGEVFTSMLGLHLMRARIINRRTNNILNSEPNSQSLPQSDSNTDHIELRMITDHNFTEEKSNTKQEEEGNLKLKSIKILAYLVSCYLLVVHVTVSSLISIYLSLIPSAKRVLKTKGLKIETFSIFTTVSTFSNCGFIPTNENMVVLKKNSGLLLILIPQILMGNTLYPVCLRLSIWFMEKFTKRSEFRYMLKNSRKLGYGHLLSGKHCFYLANTALGFIVLQLAIFCVLHWNADAIGGLNAYQKLVGSLFQVVNSRHAGESVVDLSSISPAILVLFVVMMYLPPYTSYLPISEEDDIGPHKKEKNTIKKRNIWELLLFSQLTYLVIFVILICITERNHMKRDPLNFSVLNVVIEVISAYGNVGFSSGYSCKRQIHPDSQCKDAWYGFVGKWSDVGKFLLIVVMFFGRLKKFSTRGGKFWSLA
ncbi:hypothetical protein CDL12_06079 [Handroanthus impetiginosus]|uniref:Uncharacterized protein n=1 Tax=Handroanthus impetiginosus TaxID=429701 RepID=A0A2G9HUN3_9LAMI|nr:hypothetical protein CDL12_06079 [Handroanthus impetiginosus]